MPSQELLTLDSLAESASNAPVELNDLVSSFLLEHAYPTPDDQRQMAGSASTEGDLIANSRPQNRTVTIKTRIREPQSGTPSFNALVSTLSHKIAKLNAEGGTLTRTLTTGETITFDVIAASLDVPTDKRTLVLKTADVSVTLDCKPYGRGPETLLGYYADDFSTHNLASYATDEGSAAALTVSGGQLAPASVATTTLARPAAWSTARIMLKETIGAAVSSATSAVVFKRLDAANHLSVRRAPSGLAIFKRDGGTYTQLGTTSSYTFAASTAYWIRGRILANVIVGEVFTADPRTGATAVATVTYTLTGSDATKFGTGVSGGYGLRVAPTATDFRYDDFTAEQWFETSSPALMFTASNVKGDVPADARLIVRNNSKFPQWRTLWGVQSRTYDPAASSALLYHLGDPASGTPIAPAARNSPQPSSAYGTYVRMVLDPNYPGEWTEMFSTGKLTHKGTYRVFVRARVTGGAQTAVYQLALQWSEGDYRRPTLNPAQAIPPLSYGGTSWQLVDLGTVSIAADSWEGRILNRWTIQSPYQVGATEEFQLDHLILIPCDEGQGESNGVLTAEPASVNARNPFRQASDLNSYDGDVFFSDVYNASGTTGGDFTINTANGTLQRVITSENQGRVLTTGGFQRSQSAQVDFMTTSLSNTLTQGVVLRWTDTTHFVNFYVSNQSLVGVKIFGSGTATNVCSLGLGFGYMVPNAWYTLRVRIEKSGQWFAYLGPRGNATLVASGYDEDFALNNGRSLYWGRAGVMDAYEGATAITRQYDNFVTRLPAGDASIFNSGTVEFRSDGAVRQTEDLNTTTPLSRYEGSYFRLPPAGVENRSARIVVKPQRNPPQLQDMSTNWVMDDTSAAVAYRPRYLVVPEPA